MTDTAKRSGGTGTEDTSGSTSVADSSEGDAADYVGPAGSQNSSGDAPTIIAGTATADFGALVARLRTTFRSGRTKDVAWRRTQLQNLLRMLEDHEDEFLTALNQDLSRPPLE